MNRRTFLPEGLVRTKLETRALLSTIAPPSAMISITASASLGVAKGTYTEKTMPDVGSTMTFTGSRKVAGLGAVKYTGTLHGVGFIASGHATGTETITTKRGSLTLSLTSLTQGGSGGGQLPTHYTGTVTHGTGTYASVKGSGSVDFTFTPGKPAGLRSHGKFTETLGTVTS